MRWRQCQWRCLCLRRRRQRSHSNAAADCGLDGSKLIMIQCAKSLNEQASERIFLAIGVAFDLERSHERLHLAFLQY